MLILRRFTVSLPLLLSLTLATSCIQALPPPPLLCTVLYPKLLSPLPAITAYPDVTLFHQTSFSLSADFSASFTFTTTGDVDQQEPEPSLVFIIVNPSLRATPPSSLQFPAASTDPEYFYICNYSIPLTYKREVLNPDDDHCDNHELKDELALAYRADVGELCLQVVDYRHGSVSKANFTFTFSTISDSTKENTTFFVGYLTSGKPSLIMPSAQSPLVPTTAHSNHMKLWAWILVGTFVVGTLVGLLMLVLLIKKNHGRHPPRSSHLVEHHGSPPLPRRAPFYHRDLESSATPMMSAPSPPHLYPNAFQVSGTTGTGTASWLKQPNPR